MGLLKALFGGGRNKKRREPKPQGPRRLVRVVCRDLDRAAGDYGRTYTYIWWLPRRPQIGDRVIVPGTEGPSPAIVVEMGKERDLIGHDPKEVTRLATEEEIARTVAKREADLNSWLDMARKAAGLTSRSRRRTPPDGYHELPPTSGEASSAWEASTRGSAWWKAYKNARDDEERRAFRAIGRHWYAERDRLEEAEGEEL